MWTSTLDLNPQRMFVVRLLSRFWRSVSASSLSPLRVENLPRPSLPANDWVRVRNRLAGVSGSDLYLLRGQSDPRIAPAAIATQHRTYPGLEVVGEVIEIGEDVHHLSVGDRVVLQNQPNCVAAGMQSLCRSCAVGEYNLCERALFPGPQPIGGGWSEEMLLHEQMLFSVAPELSDEQAVMLEPAAIALHALLRRLPRPGEHVLIIGAGTIGLLALQLIRILVPRATVSVLARHAFQVEQATRMGATHIIYQRDSYNGVQRATGAQRHQGVLGNRMLMGGYDIIYDTVGSNKTLHHALRWVHARGAVVLVGIHPALMYIDLSPLWFQQIDLLGSHSHGMDAWPLGRQDRQSTLGIVQQLMKDGQIHPEQLISHRFALNNYREALLVAMGKEQSRAIKVVFDYSLLPASVVPNVRASARKPRPAVVNSSPVTRRAVTSDSQDWSDIPMTPLPVSAPNRVESEETAHALPAAPRSALVSTRPGRQEKQNQRPPHTSTTGEMSRPEKAYVAEDDEATIVVRMSDVQAAQEAMEALDRRTLDFSALSTPHVQEERPASTLPPTISQPGQVGIDAEAHKQEPADAQEQPDGVVAQEVAQPVAAEEQPEVSVIEHEEEEPRDAIDVASTSVAVSEEQPRDVPDDALYGAEQAAAEDAAEDNVSAGEEQSLADIAQRATDAEDEQEKEPQEEMLRPEQSDATPSEAVESSEVATNISSQAPQQPERVFTMKSQPRPHNSSKKNRSRK